MLLGYTTAARELRAQTLLSDRHGCCSKQHSLLSCASGETSGYLFGTTTTTAAAPLRLLLPADVRLPAVC